MDGREVDVDVTEPGPADGEGGGQRDQRVVLSRQRGEPDRHVHVGGDEHAGVVERLQRGRRAQRAADVERVGDELAHPALPRSSTSLSACTSPAGGRHANTPHGAPPTRGTSAPVIPRRNR